MRPAIVVVALLLSCSTVLAEHTCIYGLVRLQQAQSGTVPSGKEKEYSRLTENQFEAARYLKFYSDFSNLYETDTLCERAGQTRSTLLGESITCAEEDVLTDEKRDILEHYIIPEATSLISSAVKATYSGTLSFNPPQNSPCRLFKIPEALQQEINADVILLVGAAPLLTPSVWSTPCEFFSFSNDFRAAVNVPPRMIKRDNKSVRAVAHQLIHILSGDFLSRSYAYLPQYDERGKTTCAYSFTQAVNAAREHYGCEPMTRVELASCEDLIHWSPRTAKDDLMSAVANDMMYMTAITLATLETVGAYAVNYNKVERMPFGYKSGCDFLQKPCLVDGKSLFPDIWADHDNRVRCTPDRLAIGTSDTVRNRSQRCVSNIYDYFGDGMCNDEAAFDYCPRFLPTTYCVNSESTVGRCINEASDSGAECFDIICDYTAKTFLIVQYTTSKVAPIVSCSEGSTFASRGKQYTCPRYVDMCPYKGAGYTQKSNSVTFNLYIPFAVLAFLLFCCWM